MTHRQVDEIERALQASSAAVRRLFDSHSPEQLTHRPRRDAWSAVDCVAHLCLTAAALVPLLEAALRDLREKGRSRASPSRMDWTGRLINWSLEPRWLRTKTVARFEPVSVGPLAEVLPDFLGYQDGILRLLHSAQGLDLTAAKIASPFDERVRYNAYSAFRILETHERRHLRQAQAAASASS